MIKCLWNVDPKQREFRGYEGWGPSDGISALVSRGRDVNLSVPTLTPGKGCLNRPPEDSCHGAREEHRNHGVSHQEPDLLAP